MSGKGGARTKSEGGEAWENKIHPNIGGHLKGICSSHFPFLHSPPTNINITLSLLIGHYSFSKAKL